MELVVFLTFAVLAVLSAMVVVTHPDPVYSTMSLVVTMISIAVFFVLLGAPFLAALQILVYTGAILVLFLFVLMLLNVGRDETPRGHRLQRWIATLSAIAFTVLVATLARESLGGRTVEFDDVDLVPLAETVLGTYLLPFEIVGLLLLAAVIAATALAKRIDEPEENS